MNTKLIIKFLEHFDKKTTDKEPLFVWMPKGVTKRFAGPTHICVDRYKVEGVWVVGIETKKRFGSSDMYILTVSGDTPVSTCQIMKLLNGTHSHLISNFTGFLSESDCKREVDKLNKQLRKQHKLLVKQLREQTEEIDAYTNSLCQK